MSDERKLVTVLFADVTGSTALGERIDPERLRAVLDDYFGEMSAVVETWGGTVEKFIGDAVVAAFGVPVVREDDPSRALRAALAMHDRMATLNERLRQRHGLTLSVRIGVNTGEVIARSAADRGQGMVAGDPVNVAARLQEAAAPGGVLAGERTYLAARSGFRFDEPVRLELKGKHGTVTARRVLGPLREPIRGIPGLEARMIGRERELRTILEITEEVRESRRPQLALILGPAGIGKTRLVREAEARIATASEPATVLRGRCLPAGDGITYWALAEILRSTCGISLDVPAEEAELKLRAGVGAIVGPTTRDDAGLERVIAALARTAGITLADDALEGVDPQGIAAESAHAWPRLATALAAARPTVIIVEDLHWATEPLIEMLDRLLTRSEGPLLVLATARPEFAHDRAALMTAREDVTVLPLRPLTDRQSEQLFVALLDVAEFPSALRRGIVDKAEGNPFFLEEILRRLIEERAVVDADGRWTAGAGAATVTVPDTVHGLLAARIDALPADEKRVLQAASVVGRIFWDEPVRRSVGTADVHPVLLRLEAKGLVAARPSSSMSGHAEYAFKHALVRDVAMASLPKARRARAHADVGHWVAEVAADRTDEFAELLAHFYGSAVLDDDADLAWTAEPERFGSVRRSAFEALMRAGDAARGRYALAKAIELHRKALSAAAGEIERSSGLEAVGDDEEVGFHGDEAWAVYSEALGSARARQDDASVARIAVKMGRIGTKVGPFRTPPDPAAVEAIINEGLAASPAVEQQAWLLALKGACGDMYTSLLHDDPHGPDRRMAWAVEGRRLAELHGLPAVEAYASAAISEIHEAQGDIRSAIAELRRTLGLLDRLRRAEQAFMLFSAASAIADFEGALDEAHDLALRALQRGRETSPHDVMHGTMIALWTAYHAGRWDEMPPLLEEHVQALRLETADRSCGALRTGPLIGALVAAHQGDPDRARELLEVGSAPIIGTPELWRARVLLALGEKEEARELAVRAFDPAASAGRVPFLEIQAALDDATAAAPVLVSLRADPPWELHAAPRVDRAEARLLVSRDPDRARELFRSAITGLDRLHLLFEAAQAREWLAPFVPAAEREALLGAALDVYDRLDARPAGDRIREELARGLVALGRAPGAPDIVGRGGPD